MSFVGLDVNNGEYSERVGRKGQNPGPRTGEFRRRCNHNRRETKTRVTSLNDSVS